MAKGNRKVPGINASSTADISFILLIFFLVTTSMDTDRGLHVRLPEPPKENQEPPEVFKRNMLLVNVNMNGQIMVTRGEFEAMEVDLNTDASRRVFRDMVKEFITNPSNSEKLPKFYEEELPAPFGKTLTTKNHVISLQTDRATKYDIFFLVSNELYGAYNELRDELAHKTFNRAYAECNEDEQLAVRQYYKCMISEAEPKVYN